jgi:methylated-DNA-[protein]-cysteine S-methyltransferase
MTRRRNADAGKFYSVFETSLGVGGVVASEAGLLEVFPPFGGASLAEMMAHIVELYPAAEADNPATRRAAHLLRCYFAGEPVIFDLPLDWSVFTPFQDAVYHAVVNLPAGTTRSYGEIARQIRKPRAARGVGRAMARNPLPIIIPCHRVVGATGGLTGYSAAGGVLSKKWLLDLEQRGIQGKIP